MPKEKDCRSLFTVTWKCFDLTTLKLLDTNLFGFSLAGCLLDKKGKILIPGINDAVAPLTDEELKLYEKIDFDVEEYAKDVGATKLLHDSKVMRAFSLSFPLPTFFLLGQSYFRWTPPETAQCHTWLLGLLK